MPAASAIFRIPVAALRHEPSWPSWAAVVAEYALTPVSGYETAEFADGTLRQARAAASTTLRRRVLVEIPDRRLKLWRRFLVSAAGIALRWRDPEDGVLRRVVMEAATPGIEIRQRARRPGRPVWQSAVTLVGFEDDIIAEA